MRVSEQGDSVLVRVRVIRGSSFRDGKISDGKRFYPKFLRPKFFEHNARFMVT